MLRSKWIGSIVVLFGAAVMLAQPVMADIIEEVHTINTRVEDPVPGATNLGSIAVPYFDTAGGSRTLIGVRLDEHLYDDHGCSVQWTTTWSGTRNGAPWFPINTPSHMYDITRSIGVVVGPYFAGLAPAADNGGGLEGYESRGTRPCWRA